MSDQCLHCGKYGHFKRDCWKLHGKPTNTKNVNQVEETQNAGSSSSGASSSAASTTMTSATGSVRLLSSYVGPIVEELPSSDELAFTVHRGDCLKSLGPLGGLGGDLAPRSLDSCLLPLLCSLPPAGVSSPPRCFLLGLSLKV